MVKTEYPDNGVGRWTRRAMQITAWPAFFGFLIADYGLGWIHHELDFRLYILIGLIALFAHKPFDNLVVALFYRWVKK